MILSRSDASVLPGSVWATPLRSLTRKLIAAFEASLSRTTFQFSSNTSPPCDQRIGRKSATTGFVALPRMMYPATVPGLFWALAFVSTSS